MMQILRRKNPFTFSPSTAPLRFSSQLCGFSSSPSPPPEPESHTSWRNANVSVWWDLDTCTVPAADTAAAIPTTVEKALLAYEVEGPRSITAFGDLSRLPGTTHEALSTSGINLTHLSKGSFVDIDFFNSISKWVHVNPPPAHVFLLSGNQQFACTLSRLRCNYYNVLLATPTPLAEAPEYLAGAATMGWEWSSLLKGEVLATKMREAPDITSDQYSEYVIDPFANAKMLFRPDHERRAIIMLKLHEKKIRKLLRSYKRPVSFEELRRKLMKYDIYLHKLGDGDFGAFLGRVANIEVSNEGEDPYACFKPSEDAYESGRSEFEESEDDIEDSDSDDSAAEESK